MIRRSRIGGLGIYVPETVMTNDDLAKIVDTNDEWISSRTGIKQRHIWDLADKEVRSSDLAILAAKKVLEQTGTDPLEIDGIIVGSLNPDFSFPATACVVQAALGCTNAFAYDQVAACAFIPFGLSHASLLVESGQCEKVLVIGAELISRTLDWTDRNTCVLFGDAAAALLIERAEDEEHGILASAMKSDGRAAQILTYKPNDGSDHCLRMEGKHVYKMAVTEMPNIVESTLAKHGYTTADIGLLVAHQANIRILEATKDRLKLRDDQVIVNVHKYGNTSSASIPLALQEALETGRIKRGDLVVFVGIGGGMSWGCTLIRWH